MQGATFRYRADIDGIRAIAVMSVILAHMGASVVSGGFLGVDVFFVISGYLITTIIKHDLDAGTFTLRGFYERRARRILPALVLVIACCAPFALWLLLPDFLQNFGQSVVATLLFANNILLAMTSGYWELESSFKPLLHTWSLGVEEQFYLAFPLFLAAIWRFGSKAQVAAIVLLGLVSFGLAELGWRTHPDASFYLPTSRAWELMVGCAIAYVPMRPRPADSAIALLCLPMLVLPMVLFDETTPSPSVYSAVPVLATAGLLVFNRPGTIAFRLLGLKPLVFIGLISYSAYLWHQPLFAFVRIASLEPPGAIEMAVLTVLTLALAAASWRFVEVPFRDRKAIKLPRFLLIIVPSSALLIGFGIVLHIKEGFPRWSFPNIGAAGDVYISYNERIRRYQVAAFPNDRSANVLLIGNSYARDVGNILFESGALDGKNLVYLERDLGCGFVAGPSEAGLFRDASVIVIALNSQDADCAARIDAQVAAISHAGAIFFGGKDFGYNINPFGRVPMERRDSVFARVPEAEVRSNDGAAGALPPARFVDLIRLMGPDGKRVRFFDERGNPLSPDRKHLTRYGAIFVARKLAAAKPPAWRAISGATASGG